MKPTLKQRTDPRSAFNWNNGEPSCMYTEAGHKIAQKQVIAGRAMDCQGRAIVAMSPRTAQAISIGTQSDYDKSQKIKHGRSI